MKMDKRQINILLLLVMLIFGGAFLSRCAMMQRQYYVVEYPLREPDERLRFISDPLWADSLVLELIPEYYDHVATALTDSSVRVLVVPMLP